MAKATRENEPDEPVDTGSTDDETPDTDTDTDTDEMPDTDTETETDADTETDTEIEAAADDEADDDEDTATGAAGATAVGRPTSTAKKSTRPAKKSQANTRRQRLAAMEARRKAEQRRRTLILLGICLVLAVAVLAYPVFVFVQDVRLRNTPLTEIGAAADAAGCLQIEENPATGNQEHVDDGTVVQYARLPPDSGAHYNQWAPFATKFYAEGDRPAVENLVHNLEHGYMVIWYRSTLDSRQVKQLEQITRTFSGTDPGDKVIAAPWDPATDGGDFPPGTNVILTRWYADPAAPADPSKQKGIRLSCAAVSGAVVDKFHTDYPPAAAPEPNGG